MGYDVLLISYLSNSIQLRIVSWLNEGNADDTGLNGHEFSQPRDLHSLTDSDIESILILMMRPTEVGQLTRLMHSLKVYISDKLV